MKQETLEEVIDNYVYKTSNEKNICDIVVKAIKFGVKWNQERSYSEEDIKLAFEAGHKKGFSGYPNTENWKELPFKEWFEKFKKK